MSYLLSKNPYQLSKIKYKNEMVYHEEPVFHIIINIQYKCL